MRDRQKSKIPTVNVRVKDIETEIILDTGASIDILDKVTFQQINRSNNIILQSSFKCLFVYRSTDKLRTVGQLESLISYQDNQCVMTIDVHKRNHDSLLSC